jgi:hypothetical protein
MGELAFISEAARKAHYGELRMVHGPMTEFEWETAIDNVAQNRYVVAIAELAIIGYTNAIDPCDRADIDKLGQQSFYDVLQEEHQLSEDDMQIAIVLCEERVKDRNSHTEYGNQVE